MPDSPFSDRIETGHIQLAENDWLIQYTDGVNEAQNSSGEEFGMNRLADVVKSPATLNPSDLVDATIRSLETFVGSAPQYDDITILVMKWGQISADSRSVSEVEEICAGK